MYVGDRCDGIIQYVSSLVARDDRVLYFLIPVVIIPNL